VSFALGIDAVPAEAVEDVDVDEALGRHTDAPLRFVASDGGVVEASDDVRESEDSRANENTARSRDAVVLEEDAEDECEECAELDGLPCFECWMNERGHTVDV